MVPSSLSAGISRSFFESFYPLESAQLTTGFTNNSGRELALFDPRNMSKSLGEVQVREGIKFVCCFQVIFV